MSDVSSYQLILDCLMQPSLALKASMVNDLYAQLSSNQKNDFSPIAVKRIEIPGRPDKPVLVQPTKVNKRSFATKEGRLSLMHSLAHIEFNAINLALDAAYRFQQMPEAFCIDWLRVAKEEVYHFSLVQQYLAENGSHYGAFTAHHGLWDMVVKTDHDVLHRMALVPRVMEARGLDVAPKMIERFEQIKDQQAADILKIIYRDEIGHVTIGNHWYSYCCEQKGLEPQATFKDLVNTYFDGKLKGPLNWPARIEAGFCEEELQQLESVT